MSEIKVCKCPACGQMAPLESFVEGVCVVCNAQGYWMDPAGTLQQGDDEPWRAYE